MSFWNKSPKTHQRLETGPMAVSYLWREHLVYIGGSFAQGR
jgi:hypothetical protein